MMMVVVMMVVIMVMAVMMMVMVMEVTTMSKVMDDQEHSFKKKLTKFPGWG